MARALIKKSNIIVADEPTSNIDLNTDSLIQKAIRDREGLMSNRTVIMIAHRLHSIIDFDLILVLDDGAVVEFDKPYTLLEKSEDDESALFLRMVNTSGAQEELKRLTKST